MEHRGFVHIFEFFLGIDIFDFAFSSDVIYWNTVMY